MLLYSVIADVRNSWNFTDTKQILSRVNNSTIINSWYYCSQSTDYSMNTREIKKLQIKNYCPLGVYHISNGPYILPRQNQYPPLYTVIYSLTCYYRQQYPN